MEGEMFFKRDKQTEFLVIIKRCLVQFKVILYISLFSIPAQYIKEEIGYGINGRTVPCYK